MDIEQLQRNTEILEQANAALTQLQNVGKVCLLYKQGANANACMERIYKIILGDSYKSPEEV